MTRIYYIKKRASDLKLGDKFVDWAIHPVYGKSRRILNIKKIDDHLDVSLDDLATLKFHPQHSVVIEVMA